MDTRISTWNKKFEKAPVHEVLGYFNKEFGNTICLSSSMGAEDQILTDMLIKINPDFRILTLDTGRLFPETLNLIQKTNDHYNINLDVIFPDYAKVESMVKEKGTNLFYKSVDDRKLCCQIRKNEPLQRALRGMKAWITGIRKDQTINRFSTNIVEWDESYHLVKINPLYRWSESMVWTYIHEHKVPYNELHDKNYPSIGCQPCTRATVKGEDARAGRWWWEDQGHKECGLHLKES